MTLRFVVKEQEMAMQPNATNCYSFERFTPLRPGW